MLERIQAWDNRILTKLAKKHTPKLNKLMIFVTTTGNNGYIWLALSIPLLFMNRWRVVGYTMLLSMLITGLCGEITIKHIVTKTPCRK